MGSIECLGVVETMYGNIQVEVRMNMNAANPKEKDLLEVEVPWRLLAMFIRRDWRTTSLLLKLSSRYPKA